MATPTLNDPKLLSDYGGGWERRHRKSRKEGVTMSSSGGYRVGNASLGIESEQGKRITQMLRAKGQLKSAEEVPLTRAEKHKAVVKRSIAASEKRRAALKAMYQAEKDAEFSARKQALDEYKAYAEGAPDPKLDVSGEGRAAYFNTDIGKQVTGNLGAHIQASKDKMSRNDPNSPENRGPSREEYEQKKSVGEVFDGYGRKVKARGGAGTKRDESVAGTTQTINGEVVTFSGETGKDAKGTYYVGVLPNSKKVKVRVGDYKPDEKDAGGDYKGFEFPGKVLKAGARVTDVEEVT